MKLRRKNKINTDIANTAAEAPPLATDSLPESEPEEMELEVESEEVFEETVEEEQLQEFFKTETEPDEFVLDEETAKILAEVAEIEEEKSFSGILKVAEGKAVKESEPIDKPYRALIDAVSEKSPIRLSASADERVAARVIRDRFTDELGTPSRMEPFDVHPFAGRQGFPIYAALLLFTFIMYIAYAPVAIALSALLFAMLFIQVYQNKNTFNFLFKKRKSYNIVTSVDNGKDIKKTIVLGSNYDCDYGRLDFFDFLKDDKLPRKLSYAFKIYVFASVVVLGIFSIIKTILMFATGIYHQGISGERATMFILPLIITMLAIIYMLSRCVYIKKYARGESNISGVGAAVSVAKYFAQNRKELPKDCRLAVVAFGSNNAGIKGSESFLKQHKEDGFLVDPIFIELDNLFEGDYCIAKKDVQLKTEYDIGMAEIAKKTFDKNGIDCKIVELDIPADATNFQRANIKSLCITRRVFGIKEQTEDESIEQQCNTIIDLVKSIAKESEKE